MKRLVTESEMLNVVSHLAMESRRRDSFYSYNLYDNCIACSIEYPLPLLIGEYPSQHDVYHKKEGLAKASNHYTLKAWLVGIQVCSLDAHYHLSYRLSSCVFKIGPIAKEYKACYQKWQCTRKKTSKPPPVTHGSSSVEEEWSSILSINYHPLVSAKHERTCQCQANDYPYCSIDYYEINNPCDKPVYP